MIVSFQTLSRGIPKSQLPPARHHRQLLNFPDQVSQGIARVKAELEARIGASCSFSMFVVLAVQGLAKTLKDDPSWIPPLFAKNRDKVI